MPLPSADSLPDGDHSGFVIGFDGQAITFDPAEMLPDDEAPNGFRIENPDDTKLLLEVAPSATAALIDSTSIEPRNVDLATFGAFLEGAGPDWVYGSPAYFFAAIELREGAVVSIVEIYLP